MERALREADYLRHAAEELTKLAPQPGEETSLAERRTTMMQGEKVANDLRETQDAVVRLAFAGARARRRRAPAGAARRAGADAGRAGRAGASMPR